MEIRIPAFVLKELNAHPDSVALAAIQSALAAGWILSSSVSASPLLSLLSLQLHRGEAESIALAAELDADVVLIDEHEGRQLASQMGLKVTGVLGILLRAKLNGEIPALKPEIQSLRTKGHFFIAPSLEAQVLAAADE